MDTVALPSRSSNLLTSESTTDELVERDGYLRDQPTKHDGTHRIAWFKLEKMWLNGRWNEEKAIRLFKIALLGPRALSEEGMEFASTMYDKISKEMERLAKKGGVERFSQLRWLSHDDLDNLADLFLMYKIGVQEVTGGFVGKKERQIVPNYMGISAKWDWRWLVLPAGRANFWFGASGYGKTNAVAWIMKHICELYPDIEYIGNIPYYNWVIDSHKNMHRENTMRGILKKALEIRLANKNAHIIAVLDEASTRMNKKANAQNQDEISQVEACAKQFRKVKISLLFLFQEPDDRPPTFRAKNGGLTNHSAYYAHHANRPIYDDLGMCLQEIKVDEVTMEYKKVVTFEFKDRTRGQDGVEVMFDIPDAHTLYNTFCMTDFVNNLNFIAYARDVAAELPDADSEDDLDDWIVSFCKFGLDGLAKGKWEFEDAEARKKGQQSVKEKMHELAQITNEKWETKMSDGKKKSKEDNRRVLFIKKHRDKAMEWKDVLILYNEKFEENKGLEALSKWYRRTLRDAF